MKVYIHYNARDFIAPNGQNDRWNNYTNPDSAKMFLVCAESWKRQGFEPVRLNSFGVSGFHFNGELKRIQVHDNMTGKTDFEYPLEFWNVWFQLRKLAPCLFVTIDVINFGLKEREMKLVCHLTFESALTFNKTPNWSNSCCYVSREFCDWAIDTIYKVDSGKLAMPRCIITTDEAIMRENLTFQHRVYTCYHESGNLIHYHRSMLANALDLHPVYAGA